MSDNQQKNIVSCLRAMRKQFEEAGIDSPKLSAELILAAALNTTKIGLISHPERVLDEGERTLCESLAARRAKGEPMAYILGKKEFYSLNFIITPHVLVPRPETELLVDFALEAAAPNLPIFFADLGTGSGCILISLLVNRPLWCAVGVDISYQALMVAQKNAALHGAGSRTIFINNSFAALALKRSSLDLIVSNPPYIPDPDYRQLSKEILHYEPKLALVSGPAGLNDPRLVALAAGVALKPGGVLLMEIDSSQGESAPLLFDNDIWQSVEVIKDLAGKSRIVRACKAQ